MASAAVPVAESRRWFLEELAISAARQYALIAEDPEEPFAMRYTGHLAAVDTPYKTMLEGEDFLKK